MPSPAVEPEEKTNTVSLVVALAEYAATFAVNSGSAITAARQCLIEALARGFETVRDPECAPLIAPIVPGALMPGGARVPGTSLELEPAQAAFCTTVMLCRSARGDPWLALSHGHMADPLGAIVSVADYQARKAVMEGKPPPKVRDVLAAIVKALEIQGVLASQGSVLLTRTVAIRLARVAAASIATAQLGGTLAQTVSALGHACFDDGMATEAHERSDIGRRDWDTADAISRAVRHACRVIAAGSSGLRTSLDARAMDRASELLGGKSCLATQCFGTQLADRVGRGRKPQDVAALAARFQAAVERYFPARQAERVKALFAMPERLDDLPFNEAMAALVTNGRQGSTLGRGGTGPAG